MEKIANFTTIEQSSALFEAGVSPQSADLYYDKWGYLRLPVQQMIRNKQFFAENPDAMPCWSATRLLALLPDHITFCETGRTRKQYHLEISKYEPWDYGVCYVYGFYPDESVLKETGGENLLDALVEMLCWVMYNHYEDTETQSKIINEE